MISLTNLIVSQAIIFKSKLLKDKADLQCRIINHAPLEPVHLPNNTPSNYGGAFLVKYKELIGIGYRATGPKTSVQH